LLRENKQGVLVVLVVVVGKDIRMMRDENKDMDEEYKVQFWITPSHRLPPTATMGDEDEIQYVKLISAEGHEFIMDRSIAVAYSKTIAMMLEGSFLEARENIVRFPEMAGYILERIVKYLHYKAQHSNSASRIPDFVSCCWLGKNSGM
jgi:elongin-C